MIAWYSYGKMNTKYHNYSCIIFVYDIWYSSILTSLIAAMHESG